MLRLVRLDQIQFEELTTVWNLVLHSSDQLKIGQALYKQEHLQAYCLLHSISLSFSVGLLAYGRLVGISLLGQNRQDGWLAFLGVLPAFREKGLSRVILGYQLAICDKIKINNISLEVNAGHFISAVYHSFGFRICNQLSNYTLSKNDLYYLNAWSCSKHCYQTVPATVYFKARDQLSLSFSWRRRNYILENFKGLLYYLSSDQRSGYVLNRGKILLDIWSKSDIQAPSVLAAVSRHFEIIAISNQIKDPLGAYLHTSQIKPFRIQFEMIRFL